MPQITWNQRFYHFSTLWTLKKVFIQIFRDNQDQSKENPYPNPQRPPVQLPQNHVRQQPLPQRLPLAHWWRPPLQNHWVHVKRLGLPNKWEPTLMLWWPISLILVCDILSKFKNFSAICILRQINFEKSSLKNGHFGNFEGLKCCKTKVQRL